MAFCMAIVFVAYSNALEGPFLWDDRRLILENPSIQAPSSLGSVFTEPFWTQGVSRTARCYYRPLTTLPYIVDFHLWGANSAGFHATNLLAHLVNVLLFFLVLRKWGAGTAAAGLSAPLWGVMPRISESVAWISGRTDVLAATRVCVRRRHVARGHPDRLV